MIDLFRSDKALFGKLQL